MLLETKDIAMVVERICQEGGIVPSFQESVSFGCNLLQRLGCHNGQGRAEKRSDLYSQCRVAPVLMQVCSLVLELEGGIGTRNEETNNN
jgi:hypothetical protein